jgi:bifunctional non-homologous end joining protein LigD
LPAPRSRARDGFSKIKYDGYRALIRKDGDQVELISRNGNLMNGSFPDVIEAVASVPGNFV